MLFDSFSFAIFLPITFFLYWFIFNKNKQAQNFLLIITSYFFYGCWDWRFLILLTFSILLNYVTGLKIASSSSYKKYYLICAVIINLSLLGFFKYFNFFIESFNDLLTSFGINQSVSTLYIILPVGISFYTFHGLSYIIDIYYDKIKPTRNIIDYSVFVSYFPLLVAGPIERARHLLPQLKERRKFDYLQATNGLKQILWGFLKKVVIADNCAAHVNEIFYNYTEHSGSTLLLGAFYFTIQIYCDFSGYSDIALGVSRLFGIELLKNFNYPYFSRNIAEFWRRWHISLSSWFKDYLYIPLGGSREGLPITIRNTFIIFIVSGFWHGANWTFIVWGAINALLIVPSIIIRTNRTTLDTVATGRKFPSIKECIQLLSTFILTTFAWIIFRSESISQAFHYIIRIFDSSLFSIPHHISLSLLFIILFLFIVEWINRFKNFGLENIGNNWHRSIRWSFYIIIILVIIASAPEVSQQFIYFQF